MFRIPFLIVLYTVNLAHHMKIALNLNKIIKNFMICTSKMHYKDLLNVQLDANNAQLII